VLSLCSHYRESDKGRKPRNGLSQNDYKNSKASDRFENRVPVSEELNRLSRKSTRIVLLVLFDSLFILK
jgi:hypothetical protein